MPTELMMQLRQIARQIETAQERGLLGSVPVSDRHGLTPHAVIGRLVQHYQRWRERREKARRTKAHRKAVAKQAQRSREGL
jgi:hypothetical protein